MTNRQTDPNPEPLIPILTPNAGPILANRDPDPNPNPKQEPWAAALDAERWRPANALQVSPDGRWLSVSTDRARTLILSVQSGQQVRSFSGGDFAGLELSRPVHAWHASGKYIYATNDELSGPISVWDVWSARLVCTLNGHTAQVRDLHPHPTNGTLATCSFDKSIRFWRSERAVLARATASARAVTARVAGVPGSEPQPGASDYELAAASPAGAGGEVQRMIL